ncbi:transcription elongation factor [Dyadobacter arcticus]|uniref:Transcription elongation GreA/GreB family factor n=1 Tax=Dyadobacter arcticus TaxID=1078754 RepID=A0ABX0UNJ4_9BACT|nr:transcription elongation factor [Dyadobacter arcticus]NIJ53235.1 transcription elongation GreA/GreB family factor [Dyadobacter arcticus]
MDKTLVINHLKTLLNDRMQVAWTAMEAAQESANEQGKSSMGDKYETSRSMGQLDRNMHARQFEQTRQERLILERINVNEVTQRVAVGSLLDTTGGWFFIAVSLGAVKIEDETVLAVSSSSPVGASLLGKQTGSKFDFMNKQHEIRAIW